MRVASLDLGSNTFLLLIADFEGESLKSIVHEEIRTVRLGQGVHSNKAFHPDALARAEKCFEEYSKIIRKLKPGKVLAMATSAARDVSNASSLFTLGEKYDIPIQVIPGEKEAQISFEGATFEYEDSRNIVVVDVGGGSTEVVGKDSSGHLVGKSIDIGSVRLTEMFITGHPVSTKELQALEAYCQTKLEEEKQSLLSEPIRGLVAVAGTPVMISQLLQQVEYSHDKVHGYRIRTKELLRVRNELATLSVDARKALKGMDPNRADVIVAGATILLECCNVFGVEEVNVSDHGVRYGIAHLMARDEC